MGEPALDVTIGNIHMKNPVMTASGTFGYGEEYASYFDLSCLGAVVVKGTTLEPCPGNPSPRVVETPAGMLNAVGLQNPGVKEVIKNKLPFLRRFNVPVIVNIAGWTVEEYRELAALLDKADDVSGIELNISCPNVKEGGISFGTDPRMVYNLVQNVREVFRRTLLVKLTPNVTDITEIARAAEASGADALSMINTLVGMVIDPHTQRPVLSNVTGGLSGPALRPVAVRMVWEVSRAVRVPVVGMGGICTAEDALQFLLAGACAVAVGTANFINPQTCPQVIDGIKKYLKQKGYRHVNQIIGKAQ